MSDYLNQKYDFNDPKLAAVYDELPLWSAPFGAALLDTVRFRAGINVLDIGCGCGFPLLELAQRLGPSCQVYGLDPWEQGLERARLKISQIPLPNVTLVLGAAEKIPFENNFFDLIVSNNGVNNCAGQEQVLRECYRVCRPGAQLVLTMNLPETMKEFYAVYEETLTGLGKESAVQELRQHIFEKRKPLSLMEKLIRSAGFQINQTIANSFTMRFSDGTAFFNHFFIKLYFLEPWKKIVNPDDLPTVFQILEDKLNQLAAQKGELSLTIPYACIDCRK
ncbi:MAG: class I SAM-dependent methyltransferase [Firmicutes bacterium]|nr:class I SAM-dependent methyltransferase [Bacillota bacterium]